VDSAGERAGNDRVGGLSHAIPFVGRPALRTR
jgi:hypothetical protein